MAIKGKINLGGAEPVDVEYLNFETTNESDWIRCKLEDGNEIAIKIVPTKVIKTGSKDQVTGDPVYYVLTTNVVRLIPSSQE